MFTCPRKFQLAQKKIGTVNFEVKVWKKFVQCTFWQKALNLQNKGSRLSDLENQVFVRGIMPDVNVT